MANNLQIIIDGFAVKELRCKNDICRRLIGYDNIKIGVFVYACPNCDHISIFNMKYKEVGKEFIDKLKNIQPAGAKAMAGKEGGEKSG